MLDWSLRRRFPVRFVSACSRPTSLRENCASAAEKWHSRTSRFRFWPCCCGIAAKLLPAKNCSARFGQPTRSSSSITGSTRRSISYARRLGIRRTTRASSRPCRARATASSLRWRISRRRPRFSCAGAGLFPDPGSGGPQARMVVACHRHPRCRRRCLRRVAVEQTGQDNSSRTSSGSPHQLPRPRGVSRASLRRGTVSRSSGTAPSGKISTFTSSRSARMFLSVSRRIRTVTFFLPGPPTVARSPFSAGCPTGNARGIPDPGGGRSRAKAHRGSVWW